MAIADVQVQIQRICRRTFQSELDSALEAQLCAIAVTGVSRRMRSTLLVLKISGLALSVPRKSPLPVLLPVVTQLAVTFGAALGFFARAIGVAVTSATTMTAKAATKVIILNFREFIFFALLGMKHSHSLTRYESRTCLQCALSRIDSPHRET